MQRPRLVASMLALTLTTGCTHHVRVSFPSVQPADRHSRWVSGWLWGLVGGEVNAAEYCGNRAVAVVDTKRSFGNQIIAWLTFGIYTPMHAAVTCGQGYQGYTNGPPQAAPVIYQAPAPAPVYYQAPAPAPAPGYYQAPTPGPASPAPRP